MVYKGEDFFNVLKWTYEVGGEQWFHITGIVEGGTVHVHVISPTEVHFYEKTDESNEAVKTVVEYAKLFLAGKIKWEELVQRGD